MQLPIRNPHKRSQSSPKFKKNAKIFSQALTHFYHGLPTSMEGLRYRSLACSDVNKDLTFKAKDKDQTLKAKDQYKDKDQTFQAKDQDKD